MNDWRNVLLVQMYFHSFRCYSSFNVHTFRLWFHPYVSLLCLTEKAGDQGWEKEKAGPKVHPGLHPPCGGWHHGCC